MFLKYLKPLNSNDKKNEHLCKQKFHYEYIDNLKGVLILWVIWWHAPHPMLINPYLHVPTFFFLSGMFFKNQSFNMLLSKKAKSLLIPLIFFIVFGYMVNTLLFYYDHKNFFGYNFLSIFDIFYLGHTWTTNVPAWFLIAIFNIFLVTTIFYKSILSMIKNRIVSETILLLLFFFIAIPFMNLDNGGGKLLEYERTLKYAFIFFTGYIFWKYLKSIILESYTYILLLMSIFFFTIFMIINSFDEIYGFLTLISEVFFAIFMITFVKILSIQFQNYLKVFTFSGKHSLILLGIHAPILDLIKRPLFKISKIYDIPDVWVGFVAFILTTSVCLILIRFSLNYFDNREQI